MTSTMMAQLCDKLKPPFKPRRPGVISQHVTMSEQGIPSDPGSLVFAHIDSARWIWHLRLVGR
jgi:hypothetical protein